MSHLIRLHTMRLIAFTMMVTLFAFSGSALSFGQPVPDCIGDVDGDNDVDLQDLAGLLASYGACTGDPNFNPGADLDSSGCVILTDLATLLGNYGADCTPSGDDCSDPIRATLSAYNLPYLDTNTTCDHGNNYENTCLGDYDDGEDIIYELTVLDALTVEIRLDPGSTGRSAFAIDDTCPPDGACLAYSTCAQGSHMIEYVSLDPGVYYLMVDTRPSPDCIPEYTLTIDYPVVHCPVECPPGASVESEPCGASINGGCGMFPPTFEPLTCGETVCGTIWANCGERDNDWYEVTVTEPTQFTWSVQAEFNVLMGLVETDPPGSGDCYDMLGLNPYAMGYCCGEPLSVRTDVLPPGTYWFYVSHEDFHLRPCGEWNDYVATLSCE